MLKPIYVFVGVTFAWSWLWWLPLIMSGASIVPGELPTHVPGLLGPAVGAIVAARVEGEGALKALLRRATTLRLTPLGWAAALSPLVFIGLALLLDVAMGHQTELSGLRLYPGVPDLGLAVVFVIVLIGNGFGEETGWRGYALQHLQARWGQWGGVIVLWVIWALWHAPLFLITASYRSMDPLTIVFGWGLGLLAGSIVLAHVAHLAKGAVLAVALWHTLYNFSSATALGGSSAALATTIVIIWALGLILAARLRLGRVSLTVAPV